MPVNYRSTEVRQKQIVNAARKLIIRDGSDSITVKRIAREVGISEAAIYRHFKSKKDILFLLVEDIENNLLADITAKSDNGHTPLESLDSLLKGHLTAVEKRRGISFLIIAEIISLGDKKLNKKVLLTLDKYIGRLKEILAAGVSSGEIRPDIDSEAAAILLFGMVQGVVNIWALSNRGFEPGEKYAPLWDLFRRAIASGPNEPELPIAV